MPTIAVDFDGVINDYRGFKGKGVYEDPVPGAKKSLMALKNLGWVIIINTTRLEIDKVEIYLNTHEIPYDHINFSPSTQTRRLHPAKVQADVYLDDRAINFGGDWGEAINKILSFKPWWRKKNE